jgi:hypothetical protein
MYSIVTGTFFLARAAGGAGPDFIFAVNIAHQGFILNKRPLQGIMGKSVIPALDGNEPG